MANALEFEFSSGESDNSDDEECVVLNSARDINDKFLGSKRKSESEAVNANTTNSSIVDVIDQDSSSSDSNDPKPQWPTASNQYGRTSFECHVTEQALMAITQASNQVISNETCEVLRQALLRHPMFSSLASVPNILNMIMRVVHRTEIQSGSLLWREGDAAKELFFVESGSFHFYKNPPPPDEAKDKDNDPPKSARKASTGESASKTGSIMRKRSGNNAATNRKLAAGKEEGQRIVTSPKSSAYQGANIFSSDQPAAAGAKSVNLAIEPDVRRRANSSTLSGSAASKFQQQQQRATMKRTMSSLSRTQGQGEEPSTPRTSRASGGPEDGDARHRLSRGMSWVKLKLQHTRSIPNLIGNYNAIAPHPGPSTPQGCNTKSFTHDVSAKRDSTASSSGKAVSLHVATSDTSSSPSAGLASPTATTTTSAAFNSTTVAGVVPLTNVGIARGDADRESSAAVSAPGDESNQPKPSIEEMVRVQGQDLTGECKEVCGAGDTVGDHALFFGVPRRNSLLCVEDAVLWRLDAIVFRHFIALADSTTSEGFAEVLNENASFQNLPEAKLNLVGKAATVVHFPPGQCIVKAGDKCEYLYLIQSGRVRNHINDIDRRKTRRIMKDAIGDSSAVTDSAVTDSREANKLQDNSDKVTSAPDSTQQQHVANERLLSEIVVTEGQTFGAQLLALDSPSKYDSIAESDDLFCIQVPVECLKEHMTTDELQRGAKLTALKSVPIFRRLPASDVEKLEASTAQVNFKSGTKILTKGEPADKMYVISQGQCLLDSGPAAALDIDTPTVSVVGNTQALASLASVGDTFGETALLAEHSCYTQDVYAADDNVECWAFCREEFVKTIALSANTKKQLKEHIVHRVLQRVPILNMLRASKLRQVSAVFEQKSYTDGQYIVKEGAPGTDFYVIWNGTVRVTKTTSEKGIVHLCDIHGGDFFGEMALLTNGLRTASCIALGDVICFTISQSSFTRMVGDDLLPAMQLEASNRIAFANKTLQDAHLKLLDDMKLGDLSLVRPIGKGGFGFVQLVKYAADGSMYALKQINKRRAFSDETSVEKIIGEKNALFDIRHPFTVRPVKTFVDENNMYVLMELIEAGELYQVIQNKKNKTRNRDTALMAPQARFYAACVISVLSYMHQRRYIYRDLKPENLMIDLQGYIKVIDFGLVKRHLQGHTYTFCGTPEYLAPEIVCGKGYSFGVDWWALGVLIYEMLVGFTPFRGENAEGIMQTILTGEFQFPASLKDDQARDLISSLLCTDPAKRLGTQRNGGAEIKAHKWFSAVNWRGILDRHVKAPWAPKFKEANFADVNSIEASADLPCPSNWKNEWDESWLNIAWQHQMWSSMSGSEGMGDGEEGCSVGDEQGSRKAQEEF